MAVLARITGALSLTPLYQGITAAAWIAALPALALVAMTLLVLALEKTAVSPSTIRRRISS